MIYLDEIELPADMLLEGEYEEMVLTDVERLLDGNLVVWRRYVTSGRALDLVATEDQGWIPKSTLDKVLSKLKDPSWTGLLLYEQRTYSVRFRTEDHPAIDVRPLIPRPNPASSDFFFGRIKLVTL